MKKLYIFQWIGMEFGDNFDGLVQQRHNSIANALELHLSYTNPLI